MSFFSAINNLAGKIINEATNPESVLRRSGLTVVNHTQIELLVILSELTPLHWARVLPGASYRFNSGKVWMTVSAAPYDPSKEPTPQGVALSLAAITASAILPVAAPIFLVTTAVVTISTLRNIRGCSMSGVYCDARYMIVKGSQHGDTYTLALTQPMRDAPGPWEPNLPPPQAAVPQLSAGSAEVAPQTTAAQVALQGSAAEGGAVREAPAPSLAINEHSALV